MIPCSGIFVFYEKIERPGCIARERPEIGNHFFRARWHLFFTR
jgi:hypothetical protein